MIANTGMSTSSRSRALFAGNETAHSQLPAHARPGCRRVVLQWGDRTELLRISDGDCGSPVRPTADTGQLCRRGPASGVGVLPGAGAGQAGVGYSGDVGANLGGPVNRVGVR